MEVTSITLLEIFDEAGGSSIVCTCCGVGVCWYWSSLGVSASLDIEISAVLHWSSTKVGKEFAIKRFLAFANKYRLRRFIKQIYFSGNAKNDWNTPPYSQFFLASSVIYYWILRLWSQKCDFWNVIEMVHKMITMIRMCRLRY